MDVSKLEAIDPPPLPPYRADAFTQIVIEPYRKVAKDRAESVRSTSHITVDSDASGLDGLLGVAVVAIDGN